MALYFNNKMLQDSELYKNKKEPRTLDEIENVLRNDSRFNNRSGDELTFLGMPISNFHYETKDRTPFFKKFTNYFQDRYRYNNINKDGTNDKNFDFSRLVPPVGAGLAAALQSPGTYYVQANWKGNGLANTGLGYTANPNYANPYDVGQMLASLRKLNNWSLTKDNLFNRNKNNNNVLEKLSAINEYIDNYEPLNTLEGLTGDFYDTDSMYSDIV